LPFCRISISAPKPLEPAYPRNIRSLGDHIRRRRLDLKLMQKEVADRIGVDETSILNWEKNRNRPSLTHIPKIIEFLGYWPEVVAERSFGGKIITLRRILGLTQKKLASLLGVDPSTLGDWESNKRKPTKDHLGKLEGFFTSSALTASKLGE
jgi:transcriptional regulator with XRE-family HTH domain